MSENQESPLTSPNENEGSKSSQVLIELLKFVVSRIVDHPEDIRISEAQGEKSMVLELKVNEKDMGKIIGRKGRIIRALRTLLRAAGLHHGVRVTVELKDEGVKAPASE